MFEWKALNDVEYRHTNCDEAELTSRPHPFVVSAMLFKCEFISAVEHILFLAIMPE